MAGEISDMANRSLPVLIIALCAGLTAMLIMMAYYYYLRFRGIIRLGNRITLSGLNNAYDNARNEDERKHIARCRKMYKTGLYFFLAVFLLTTVAFIIIG